jgi:hypothetical protein
MERCSYFAGNVIKLLINGKWAFREERRCCLELFVQLKAFGSDLIARQGTFKLMICKFQMVPWDQLKFTNLHCSASSFSFGFITCPKTYSDQTALGCYHTSELARARLSTSQLVMDLNIAICMTIINGLIVVSLAQQARRQSVDHGFLIIRR